jgi:hypothetical protein
MICLRGTMLAVLYQWVEDQSKYEKEELKFFSESCALASVKGLIKEIERGDSTIELITEQ